MAGGAPALDLEAVRKGRRALCRARRADHRGLGGAYDAGEEQHGALAAGADPAGGGEALPEAGLLSVGLQEVHAGVGDGLKTS